MIIVAGTLTVDPASVADYAAAVVELRRRALHEDGCSHYSLLVQDAAAGVFNVSEIWRDDEALRVHLSQPWITAFVERFQASVRAFALQIYDVASVRPFQV
ncbi:MAG TPA: antibiotic biosynthesis monooxygenase [Stellaceae bacterium]|nr:antibiotic biosynthesis monooxygenase [Stellaceae bacterium]